MNEETHAGAEVPPPLPPEAAAVPPVSVPPPLPPPPAARWRWWIHLALLVGYLATLAALGASTGAGSATRLSPDNRHVFLASLAQIAIFAAVFGLAVALSRADRDTLRLRWRDGWKPLVLGIGYSVGLRLAVGIIIAIVAGLIAVTAGLGPDQLGSFRPKVENLVDVRHLANDPWYMLILTTWVSFVLAGLTEELWRAGMLAALERLFPRWSSPGWRRFLPVVPVAVIFGLGHTAQGLPGISMTFLLGLGLGAIIVVHRSIWPAVIAHGFFNATSFLLLPIAAKYLPELLK